MCFKDYVARRKKTERNSKRKTSTVLWVFICFILFASVKAPAETKNASQEIPDIEKTANFGIVYVTQWTFYFLTQKSEIEEHGSFENWLKHPFEVHVDKDSFDFNLFRHTFVGHYYFLFYRSRGYSLESSFVWSFLSSSAFEFTIETVTERPSMQDLHLTPVLGTVVGIGVEKLSLYLHSLDNWYSHALGYLVNPFALFPPTSELFVSTSIQSDQVKTLVTWKF